MSGAVPEPGARFPVPSGSTAVAGCNGGETTAMKILIAHNFYQQSGGEDSCVAAESAMLEAHGHEVLRYSLHNDSIDSLRSWQVASRTIWSRPAAREVRELVRRHRPQIVHFHNTFPLISPAAYYAARSEGAGVVQTLHNFRLLCPNAIFLRAGRACEDCLGRSFAWPGILHKCYRGSRTATAAVATMTAVHRMFGTWRTAVDVYIALTEFGRGKFVAGGLPAERIVVKPNFVYTDPGPGIGGGGYAMFVGRLSEEKGIGTLLSAGKGVKSGLSLKIVGDGPLSPLVQEAAAIDSRIEWLGRKSPDQVHSLLKGAAFLLVPSLCYETFGLVVVEAFAAGTPVIASNLGSLAEVVDHGRTGLSFQAGNAMELTATIDRFLADPADLCRMRQAARQEFEAKYTAEANYRILMATYEQAVANKTRAMKANSTRCSN